MSMDNGSLNQLFGVYCSANNMREILHCADTGEYIKPDGKGGQLKTVHCSKPLFITDVRRFMWPLHPAFTYPSLYMSLTICSNC